MFVMDQMRSGQIMTEKETIVISRYGTDSIFQGIQKMTVTTKWELQLKN